MAWNQTRGVLIEQASTEKGLLLVPLQVEKLLAELVHVARGIGKAGARRARDQIVKWEDLGLFGFAELDRQRRLEAGDLAVKLGVRGMDSIIIQVAKENRAILITFDREMAKRAKSVVKVLTAEDIETEPR